MLLVREIEGDAVCLERWCVGIALKQNRRERG